LHVHRSRWLRPLREDGSQRRWNEGALGSFLLEISARILRVRDEFDPQAFLIDRVADRASQKGTGRLTAQEALELGEPATTVTEAVAHRSLSSLEDRRRSAVAARAAHHLVRSAPLDVGVDDVEAALLGTRIVGLAQGFDLLDAAGRRHGWPLDLPAIARVWRDGCIIRSRLLGDVAAAITAGSPHLLTDAGCAARLADADAGWRRSVSAAVGAAVPVPVMASALAWLDAFLSERLPTSLIQAQRDLFGAHSYERTDRSGSFHSAWKTSSDLV
jgi:6-phosphogluconate dehydrogenase